MSAHTNNLSNLYLRINKISLALTCVLLLSACGDNQEAQSEQSLQHIKQATAYTEQGQFRAALIEGRNAIQKTPQSAQAHIALANIYLELNQAEPALKLLEEVPKDEQSSLPFIVAKTKALIGRGKFQSALDFVKASSVTGAPEIALLEAQALHGLGELDLAIKTYQTLPLTNIDAQLGLAKIYAQKDNYRSAFEILLQLKESAPNSAEVRFFEASLAAKDGDLQRTESLLTDTLSLLPNTDIMTPLKGQVLRAMADVLAKQGRGSEALVYSKLLSDAYPGADLAQAKFKESVELFKAGKLDDAKAILSEILDTYPQFEQGAQLLGIINYLQGDYETANKYFNDYLDPETASQLAANVAAETNLKLNQPEKVMELLGTNIETTKNPETLGIYGVAALEAGQTQKGIDALNRSLKEKPENNQLRLILAKYYVANNMQEAALDQLQAAYKTSAGQKDPLVQALLAKQLMGMGKTQEADQLLAKIVNDAPDDHISYLVAANAENYRKNYAAAEANYQKALTLNPEDPTALTGYGYTSARQEKWQQALEAFKQLATTSSNNIVGYRGIIQTYVAQGKQEEGVAAVTALKQQSGDTIEPHLALAEHYTGTQEFAKAYAEIEAAKALKPEDKKLNQAETTIAYYQALNANNNNELEPAKAAALKGLQIDPNNKQLLALLINVETKLGNASDARKLAQQFEKSSYYLYEMIMGDIDVTQDLKTSALTHYEKSWSARPMDLTAKKIYSLRFTEQGRQHAFDFLEDWLNKIPNSLIAMSIDADNALAAENYERAITQLQKINRAVPNSPATLNNLAWAYLQTKNNKAVETAKMAYDLVPDNAAIADTYGWILVNTNQVKKGIEILEKALQLAPDSKEIQEHLQQAKK